MAKTAVVTPDAKNKVVRTIMAMFQLGDAGKLDYIYDKLTSKWGKDIKEHKFNLSRMEMEQQGLVDGYKEKIQEAQDDVDAVMASVDVKDAAAIRSVDVPAFVKAFETRLTTAERYVDNLKEQLEADEEDYSDEVDDINDQIAALTARIKAVKG